MKLDQLIASSRKLSATPQILPKLQKLLRDPESDLDQVVQLVKMDAPLSAQVLRMSNSAYYGAATPCKNIEEGIYRLGFHELYKLVGVVASRQVLGKAAPLYHLGPGELFRVCVCMAVVLSLLARKAREDTEVCYTIGLLHALGKIVINDYFLERNVSIYSADYNDQEEDALPQMERETLGFDHGEVAAELLKSWSFPAEVMEPIRFQYRPPEAPAPHQRRTWLLRTSHGLTRRLLGSLPANAPLRPIETQALAAIKLPPETFQDVLADAQDALADIEKLVKSA